MKLAFAISLLVLSYSFLAIAQDPCPNSVCNSKCGVRCASAAVKDRCMKYCCLCCGLCNNCVPSGTYGNKSECPCYRDMKNSKGKDKCP